MQAESKVEMHRSGGSSASDVSSTLASCLGGRLRSPPNCAKRPFFRRAQVRLAFDGAIDERRELLAITEVRLRLLIRPRRVIGSAWEVLRDAGGGPLHYREITKHRRCSTFSGGGNLESRPRSFAPTSVAFAWLSRCCSSIPRHLVLDLRTEPSAPTEYGALGSGHDDRGQRDGLRRGRCWPCAWSIRGANSGEYAPMLRAASRRTGASSELSSR